MSRSEPLGVVALEDRRTVADELFEEFVTRPLSSHRRLRLQREAALTARPVDYELGRLRAYDMETDRLRSEIRATQALSAVLGTNQENRSE